MVLPLNSANEPSAQVIVLVIHNALTEEGPSAHFGRRQFSHRERHVQFRASMSCSLVPPLKACQVIRTEATKLADRTGEHLHE